MGNIGMGIIGDCCGTENKEMVEDVVNGLKKFNLKKFLKDNRNEVGDLLIIVGKLIKNVDAEKIIKDRKSTKFSIMQLVMQDEKLLKILKEELVPILRKLAIDKNVPSEFTVALSSLITCILFAELDIKDKTVKKDGFTNSLSGKFFFGFTKLLTEYYMSKITLQANTRSLDNMFSDTGSIADLIKCSTSDSTDATDHTYAEYFEKNKKTK